MSKPATIEYIKQLITSLREVNNVEFFVEYVAREVPELPRDYVEFFLSIARQPGFIIPHTKLIEYGVAATTDSSKILKRLNTNGMINGVDYVVDVLPAAPPGQSSNLKAKAKNVYMLTERAFKKLLGRARRRPNQTSKPLKLIKLSLAGNLIYQPSTIV